jgi:hypothetical protein
MSAENDHRVAEQICSRQTFLSFDKNPARASVPTTSKTVAIAREVHTFNSAEAADVTAPKLNTIYTVEVVASALAFTNLARALMPSPIPTSSSILLL